MLKIERKSFEIILFAKTIIHQYRTFVLAAVFIVIGRSIFVRILHHWIPFAERIQTIATDHFWVSGQCGRSTYIIATIDDHRYGKTSSTSGRPGLSAQFMQSCRIDGMLVNGGRRKDGRFRFGYKNSARIIVGQIAVIIAYFQNAIVKGKYGCTSIYCYLFLCARVCVYDNQKFKFILCLFIIKMDNSCTSYHHHYGRE